MELWVRGLKGKIRAGKVRGKERKEKVKENKKRKQRGLEDAIRERGETECRNAKEKITTTTKKRDRGERKKS